CWQAPHPAHHDPPEMGVGVALSLSYEQSPEQRAGERRRQGTRRRSNGFLGVPVPSVDHSVTTLRVLIRTLHQSLLSIDLLPISLRASALRTRQKRGEHRDFASVDSPLLSSRALE